MGLGRASGRCRALGKMAEIWVGTVLKNLRKNPPRIGVGWNMSISGGKAEEKRLVGWLSRPPGK